MAILFSEMLPPEERITMGLNLQRMSIDYGVKESEGNTYTLVLVKESGQTFQYQNIDFRDGICPIVNIDIGTLHIVATLTSWKETLVDISGKSIYTVTLTQYASIFLSPIAITEAFRVPQNFVDRGAVVDASGILQKPFLHQNTVWVSTTIVDDKVFGPSLRDIFTELTGHGFSMGGITATINFDGFLVDSDAPDLIEMQEGMTLFDAIKSYAKNNNFEYRLVFTRTQVDTVIMGIPGTDIITEISFIKTNVIDENSTLAQGYLNVFDALMATHAGEIISAEQGYSVAKDFKQNTEYVVDFTIDDEGHITSVETDTETITHPGILGVADFGERIPITIVRGGFVSDFLHFIQADIRQFWGFKSPGVLRDAPDDMVKMNKILNNEELMGDDVDLREYMNLWGKQFVVNSTHLLRQKSIDILTEDEQAAIASNEQAMMDLIGALVAHFTSLPIRQVGDDPRFATEIFDAFIAQYSTDHPEIYWSSLQEFIDVFYNTEESASLYVKLPDDFPAATFTSLIEASKAYIFRYGSNAYMSIDKIFSVISQADVYVNLGYVGLELTTNVVSPNESIQIPATVRAKSMCFPSIGHPLANTAAARGNFMSLDGRWTSYVKLPRIIIAGGGSTASWGAKISSTVNHIGNGDFHYVRVEVNQYNNYYIITLPGQLLMVTSKSTTDATTKPAELNMGTGLADAFIGSEDTKSRYGPYIVKNGKMLDENSQEFIDVMSDSSKYIVNNIVRDTLVPESFSNNGTLTKDESIEEMKKFIIKNYQSLNQSLVWAHRFGSLTVAGLPVEEAYDSITFADRATINRVNVNFGLDGVKTTYYVDSPDREDIKSTGVKLKVFKPTEEEPEVKNEETIIAEPKLESDPKQNTFSDTEKDYILRQKTGGKGVITGGAGHHYSIRRLSYSDLNGFGTNSQYAPLEWSSVENLSEPAGGSALLRDGTIVTVNIVSEGDNKFGPFIAVIEVPPPNAAPGFVTGVGGSTYDVQLAGPMWRVNAISAIVNTQEDGTDGGRLLVGSPVSIQLYNNGEDFYINSAPQVFAPPKQE